MAMVSHMPNIHNSSARHKMSESHLRLLFCTMGERIRAIVFGACCLIVAAVSVHDAMLVLLHRSTIDEFERNPVGQWLIGAQDGDVWFFLLTKLVGTAVVFTALIALYEHRSRLALLVAGGVAACQLILFCYLTFG